MRHSMGRKEIAETFVHAILYFFALVSVFTTIAIIFTIGYEAYNFFKVVSLVDFFTDTEWTPLFTVKHYGILPLALGTIITSAVALFVSLPLGIVIAVYLSEYADKTTRRILKPILELLAGIPTIVYGYFALFVVTPLLQQIIPSLTGFNALSAGLVMGFMILPMIASLTEDAFFSVPQSIREAAYALGATRVQMISRVLIPSALGGISASFILAISRAIGETMIVAIAAGQQPTVTISPLQSVETMTAYIVQISLGDVPHGTLEYNTIFAVAFCLFCITFALNYLSIALRDRYRNRYI